MHAVLGSHHFRLLLDVDRWEVQRRDESEWEGLE